jgi:hypothetical protein
MNPNGQITGTAQDQMSMFILDVLRHDVVEQVPSILNLLNNDGGVGWRDCWPHDFTLDEIVPALEKLVQAGFVVALREQEAGSDLSPVNVQELDISRDQEALWFGLTEEGRRVWDQWEPPQ